MTTGKMAPRAEAPPVRFDARLRMSIRAVAITGATLALFALAFVGVGAAISVAAARPGRGQPLAARPDRRRAPPRRPAGAEAQSRAGWALVAVLKMFGLLGARMAAHASRHRLAPADARRLRRPADRDCHRLARER